MRDFPTPLIGFVAPSGTGKTTLIKRLVPELVKRGVRVGYLKHAHHSFDLDVPGKDSYEIRAAGARQTLLASKERWALQCEAAEKETDPSLEEMLAHFDAERLDLILVEGFKHAAYPKIEVHRSEAGESPLYLDDPHLVALVTETPPAGEHRLPCLAPGDLGAIADFVQRHMQAWQGARAASGIAPASDLRAELVRYSRSLRRYGCDDAQTGNASVREGDNVWITAAGACADNLDVQDLAACRMDGTCGEGASADAPLHLSVYRSQPRAAAIFYSRGPYSLALSFAGKDFQPVDTWGKACCGEVPVLSADPIEQPEKAAEAVANALAERPVVMVRGHGVYAWGETPQTAYQLTCALEHAAKTFVIARQAAGL